jgi:uncharacterized OB-fold protein
MSKDDKAPAARTIPDPLVNPESRRWWEAAAEQRLLVGSCRDCARKHFYPRALCPHCMSDRTEWVEAGGEGVIYSFSVTRRGVPAPYAIAYVTLDEGVTMLTNLVDCDFDALAIGQRVRAVFRASAGGALVPVFTPA